MAEVRYAPEFFALQLSLATRAAELTGKPLPECIQDYTAIYGCFGLGVKPDRENPLWKSYISGLERGANPLEWTVQTYQALREDSTPSERYWGCFAYNLHFNDPTVVRPHFNNHDASDFGPLSSARKPTRIGELTAMFAHIQHEAPQAQTVRGESWLYNHQGYTRLFPPEFGASARPVPLETAAFQYRAIWGQLVNSEGQVRPETEETFRHELAIQTDVQTFHRCFPYRILRTESPIAAFYEFYGLPPSG